MAKEITQRRIVANPRRSLYTKPHGQADGLCRDSFLFVPGWLSGCGRGATSSPDGTGVGDSCGRNACSERYAFSDGFADCNNHIGQASPTPSRTPTAARAPATSTRQRPTPTPAPTSTPPDTLLDGNYTSVGSVRIQFIVSGGGSMVSGGFFSFRCPADGALSTYGFTDPAAIVGGQFAFSALPTTSGAPQVTLICIAITVTQARCTIRNLLATNKCLDTPATASRQ